MYAYIGLAQYEQDIDNEYKERTGYGLETTDRFGTDEDDLRIQKRDSRSENVSETSK